MKAHVVIEKGQLAKQFFGVALVALVSAAFVGLLWTTVLEAHQENQQIAVVKACRLPEVDGAMTVFVMEEGKLKCWRWK